MTNKLLRPARLADAGELTACIKAAYSVYAATVPDLPPVSEGVKEDIRNNTVLVALEDGQIIGGLILVAGDGFLKLANVAVHPDHAGTGLGRALLERAAAECVKAGFPELRLTTHAAMAGNVELYRHLGFTETGRTGNSVHMARRLRA